jgi:4-hydroxyphenylacetate 3-monooxygenase
MNIVYDKGVLLMVITGDEYLKRIDALNNEVWIHGQRVKGKINEHPAFKGVLESKAALYDLQHDPSLIDVLTFVPPNSSEKIGFSFHQPKTIEDLKKRETATKIWAKTNAGLMGRMPDYVNTGIMALATASDLFGKNEPMFGKNIKNLYHTAYEKDLSFTHTFINPQVNRSITYFEGSDENIIAAKVIKETSDGLIIKGARLLATQGGITDEILVLPSGGNFIDESFIYAFSIPSNTPGLKFICRQSFTGSDSQFDFPLSSRFEEMDSLVVFDDVLVPWERVFLYKDLEVAFQMLSETNFHTLLLYQAISRMIVKTEFILGLAELIIQSIQIGDFQHVKEKVCEIITALEIMKGLQISSRENAKLNQWGTMVPDEKPLQAAILYYTRVYPRMVEILQLLSGSGLIALPTEKDFESSIRKFLDQYLQGANSTAEERVKVFRLAWDLCMSAFGSRQTQFERFFFGDPVRLSTGFYNSYPKESFTTFAESFLI